MGGKESNRTKTKTCLYTYQLEPGPEVIKLFSCSTEQEISTAHKNLDKKFLALSLSDVVLIMLIHVKMLIIVGFLTFVGIVTFMSRINFMLS